MMYRKKISVVTPCYNEEGNVIPLYEAVCGVFDKLGDKYVHEHIFTDNASQDGTLDELRELARKDKRVKVIVNSRNFEALPSLYNGVISAYGDAIVILEADLQDPPELIAEFIKKWEEGYQVVYGIRKTRDEGVMMQMIRKAYYRLVSILSDVVIPKDAGVFRLIDRLIVDELRKIHDWNPYLRGLISYLGFKQIGIPYHRRSRFRGHSSNSILFLIGFGLNGITSHSVLPLRLCMVLGILLSGLSLSAAVIYSIFRLFVWTEHIPGLAMTTVLQLFFNGIILFFLGMLGEYVGSIHRQVRWRPLVVEAERLNFEYNFEDYGIVDQSGDNSSNADDKREEDNTEQQGKEL